LEKGSGDAGTMKREAQTAYGRGARPARRGGRLVRVVAGVRAQPGDTRERYRFLLLCVSSLTRRPGGVSRYGSFLLIHQDVRHVELFGGLSGVVYVMPRSGLTERRIR
jgi:hypothetical protein